jgi:heat-inducible transcriptional repressor
MEAQGAPLDERKQRILRALVEAYVHYGEPVGSKMVADESALGVSSATIRNEMGILEREGYIAQPHTSAGRVPTDKGYRYYVDELAPPGLVDPQRRREIEGSLLGTLSALDELLQRASTLLTEITEYTALASAPSMDDARLRSLELVPLGGGRLFLILVGEGAWHAERIVDVQTEYGPEVVRRAVSAANRRVDGCTPAEAADRLEHHTDGDEWPLLQAVAQAMRDVARGHGRVITGGASRMIAWEPASTAQRVLEVIEGGAVAGLLSSPDPERVDVRIGRELQIEDLRDLSLIAAGFSLGRQGAGSLGVLGPTRMDYPSVMSLVGLVARSVSEALRRFESS